VEFSALERKVASRAVSEVSSFVLVFRNMRQDAYMAGPARPIHTDAAEARFSAFADELLATGRAAKTVASYRSDWAGLVRWAAETLGRPFDAADLSGALIRELA
jgi:hypothetical protein